MLFAELAATSAAVAATRSRLAKRALLASLLARTPAADVAVVSRYLGGELRQRRTGLGWRSLADLPAPASIPSLTVSGVDLCFERMSLLSGSGSSTARGQLATELFSAATAPEQAMLRGLVTGELRQGSLDALLLEAVAEAAGVPADAVRRAAMLAGATEPVAVAALGSEDPLTALAAFGLVVGRPVRPMLAQSAPDVVTAFAALQPPVVVDTKLDGIRIQVHKRGDEVGVFTRSLDDITGRVPEIVAIVRGFAASDLVLDGEALAVGPDGRPRPFQETASRSASAPSDVVLTPFFFDCLHVDGTDLLDAPLLSRLASLDAVAGPWAVQRLVTSSADEAAARFAAVVSDGQEGVVVKSSTAPYEAGRRGAGWVKVKPRHTLDLVVLAVEHGSGRRRGYLSNIHLGARDPAGGFVMLGKTFKGMTDEMLAWQTARFTDLSTGDDGWVVTVRPEQVVEVAFDGLQRSSRYPGGVALRFARVLRYRDDKSPAEADTIDTVRALAVS